MLPMSTLLAGIDMLDREYWLGHCEGFRVRAGRRRVGVVDSVRYGPDPGLPETIHVCAGTVRVREVAVPVADVERLDPRTRTVWLHAPADAPAPAGHRMPSWLRRAEARARWAVQRG